MKKIKKNLEEFRNLYFFGCGIAIEIIGDDFDDVFSKRPL
jgi:hypothetical protein